MSTSSACRRRCRKRSPRLRISSSIRRRPSRGSDDLANYDAIVVGTGTRFGRMSSQMAAFLDQAGGLWAKGALNGKVGGAFTSTATQHGGQEMTLFSIIANLLALRHDHCRAAYSHARPDECSSEIAGGSPYGATTVAGGDGSRQPIGDRSRRRASSGPCDRRDREQTAWLMRHGRHSHSAMPPSRGAARNARNREPRYLKLS